MIAGDEDAHKLVVVSRDGRHGKATMACCLTKVLDKHAGDSRILQFTLGI